MSISIWTWTESNSSLGCQREARGCGSFTWWLEKSRAERNHPWRAFKGRLLTLLNNFNANDFWTLYNHHFYRTRVQTPPSLVYSILSVALSSRLTFSQPRDSTVTRIRAGPKSSRRSDGWRGYHVPINFVKVIVGDATRTHTTAFTVIITKNPETVEQLRLFAVQSTRASTCLRLQLLMVWTTLTAVPLSFSAWGRSNKVFMDHG